MRHRLLLATSVLIGLSAAFTACADDDAAPDQPDAVDSGADGRGTGGSSSSSGAPARDAAKDANGAADAADGADAADASNLDDAGDPTDAGPKDAGDAGLDASDAGGSADASDASDASDAGDAGVADAGNPNLARAATATATSAFAGYPASRTNDGILTTSWYAASGVCGNPDAGSFQCTSPTSVTLLLAAEQVISVVKIFGNRDFYSTGYDTFSARIELLGTTGSVIESADVTMTRGAEPNGDATRVFAPAAQAVKSIRVTILTGESDGPGLAEIEAYAQ